MVKLTQRMTYEWTSWSRFCVRLHYEGASDGNSIGVVHGKGDVELRVPVCCVDTKPVEDFQGSWLRDVSVNLIQVRG